MLQAALQQKVCLAALPGMFMNGFVFLAVRTLGFIEGRFGGRFVRQLGASYMKFIVKLLATWLTESSCRSLANVINAVRAKFRVWGLVSRPEISDLRSIQAKILGRLLSNTSLTKTMDCARWSKPPACALQRCPTRHAAGRISWEPQ